MGKTYYYRFILTMALAIVLTAVIGFVRPKPISSVIQKEKFWADKTHSSTKYDLIFAGDSRVYRGVDPKSITQELSGLSVLNFGFSSAGFNDEMFHEIGERLNTETEIPIVILGITPYSLTPKAQANQHFKQEKERSENEVFERRYIAPLLNFFDPIKPEDLIFYRADAPGYYEEFRKNGWVASYKIPSNPEAALMTYEKNFKENKVSAEVLKNLFKQVREWTQSGIAVFALRMPSTSKMEKLEDSISGFNEMQVILGIKNSGGIWLSQGNRFNYKSYDGSHLERESAREFSSAIGEAIKQEIKIHKPRK